MIFIHENYILDLDNPSKGKLYKDNHLIFLGDGYKAITILLRNCNDSSPVKAKFRAQLNTREKPKFEKVEKK
tara:strand:- start:1611 stop:1826 length:216 start_codon:yes stop_codon:yes gene_type:complete